MKITFKRDMERARSATVALIGTILGSALAVASCKSGDSAPPSSGGSSSALGGAPPPQTLQLNVTAVDTTFVTRDHFIASVEMQISGEPFAEAMGRDLSGFSRDFVCQLGACQASIYYDPALNDGLAGGP